MFVVLQFFIFFIILYLFIWNLLGQSKQLQEKLNKELIDVVEDDSVILLECDYTEVPCSIDINCKLCHSVNNSEYRCIDNKCKKIVNFECDETKHFYRVRNSDGFSSDWICLNTLPHIYNNDGTLREGICFNGTLDMTSGSCNCNTSLGMTPYMLQNIPLCLTMSDIIKLS